MKDSIKSGLGFGITSGIITPLGLIIGLHSSTDSNIAIIGALLIIAFADTLSDSLGMHTSKEFNKSNSTTDVWIATITSFVSKAFVAISFIIPFLIFSQIIAIIINVTWGLSLLAIFSFYIAKTRKAKILPVIIEHVGIAILVLILSQCLGSWIGKTFT
jgi:vacuolar iron transporter family protein